MSRQGGLPAQTYMFAGSPLRAGLGLLAAAALGCSSAERRPDPTPTDAGIPSPPDATRAAPDAPPTAPRDAAAAPADAAVAAALPDAVQPAVDAARPADARPDDRSPARDAAVANADVSSIEENLALGRPVTPSHPRSCHDDPRESADKAVDGRVDTKWCDWSKPPGDVHWLQVDLGGETRIGRWVVLHASSAGEATKENTRAFSLQRSSTGVDGWTDVDVVSGNTAGRTDRRVEPFVARHVRLHITAPTQPNGERTVRIYELQLFR